MKTHGSITRRKFIGQLSLAAAAMAASRPSWAADKPPEKKLGIAFLGLGNYAAHQLAPAVAATNFCRIAGVVTGSPAKGKQWEKQYDLPAGSVYSYETLERVADNPDIDIVYVVTPPGTHREFVVRAAKAGKHVLCEKPMAPSVRECDEMIGACRAAGKKLALGYRLHFEPHHIELVRLARDPKFGPFTKMRGGFGFHLNGRQWRLDKKLAGGGPLPDVGVYVIQAARRAAGAAPIAVTAHEEPKTRPELFDQVEETIRFTLEFPGGATCEGFASYTEGVDDFRAESANGNWVEIDPAYIYGGLDGRMNRGPMKQSNINQQAAEMDDFARAILDNRDSPTPGEMGRLDVEIIEAIYKAAATGTRVTL